MAETLLNKNQAGSGVFTEDNLIAGNDIAIMPKSDVNFTTFTSGNYLKLTNKLITTDGLPFELVLHFKTPSHTFSSYHRAIYDATPAGNEQFNIALNTSDWTGGANALVVTLILANGSAALDGAIFNAYHLATSTEYWLKAEYANNSITFTLAEDSLFSYNVHTETTALSDNIKQSTKPPLLGASWRNTNYTGIDDGVIYLSDCYIKKNGSFVFDGSTAVPGTDYVVNGTLTKNVISGQYQIKSTAPNVLQATGYDATKTQVLKNINGVLTWVDEA